MIKKKEIVDEADIFNLNPHIIEKDFVLGWLLWGIYRHKDLARNWIFKGGTCLRKCYVETYRFSEDLDFTVVDRNSFNISFLRRVFSQISEQVFEESGIELPPDYQTFEIYNNPHGGQSCQGRIGYLGPISPRGRSMPRIKIDLTPDEIIVLPPVQSQVFHPYSDKGKIGHSALTYDYQELFAEKVRALFERARPRDLYDIIFLFRNNEMRPAASLLYEVLREKCNYKGFDIPGFSQLELFKPTIESQWSRMLENQLPVVPRSELFWGMLPEFLIWLNGGTSPQILAKSLSDVGDELIQERDLRQHFSIGVRSHLEVIRFAASNSLCIELNYNEITKCIEPYTLSKTIENEIVLYAYDVEKEEARIFNVSSIQGVRAMNQSFTPRYCVDILPESSIPTN